MDRPADVRSFHTAAAAGAVLLLMALLMPVPAHADSRLLDQARKGDPVAAEMLAAQYETGSGVRQSASEAAYWYGQAAKAGRRSAQFSYAQFLETGNGVTKDAAAAAHWYLMAARQGHAGAAVNLAGMLATGRGTERDMMSAYRLLLAAQKFPGQESVHDILKANLDAIGAGLARSSREGATPLDLAAFDFVPVHSEVAERSTGGGHKPAH